MSTRTPFIALAGATGELGKLVAKQLRSRGATVKALVRPKTEPSRLEHLRSEGVIIASVALSDKESLTRELSGATCVVSTLQGLKDVLHTAQGQLLDAAVAAKVPRFIPSDFALDFTKTKPGSNRNLDLHREFHVQLEKSGIAWTSILNGGFMDLLGPDSPMIDRKRKKVSYAGKATQLVDFTTMADTAAFTAAVATDPNPTPKILRIAGDSISAQDMAEAAARVEKQPFGLFWMGSVSFLEYTITGLRFFGGEKKQVPLWQQMQYMTNMFSGDGKLEPLDNDRYPELKWTTLVDFLQSHK